MTLLDAQPPLADVIGLPVYVVNGVLRRHLGGGIASIINYRNIGDVRVPQCEIIIGAQDMLPIGLGAADFATELYRQLHGNMIEIVGRRH